MSILGPSTITDDFACPQCHASGRCQRNRCQLHSWAYRTWLKRANTSIPQPSTSSDDFACPQCHALGRCQPNRCQRHDWAYCTWLKRWNAQAQ